MRLLVIGGTGLLGGTFALVAAEAGNQVRIVARSGPTAPASGVELVRCDVRDDGAVNAISCVLDTSDVVINMAAATNVDACEADPAARLLNVTWPALLAAECARRGLRFVHISTDSVFEVAGPPPTEDVDPAPVNAYARQKLEAEHGVLEALPQSLVLRTNFFGWPARTRSGLAHWIVSSLEGGRPIKGFVDVHFNPLYTRHAAELLLELLTTDAAGTIHLLGGTCCSKYDFALRLARGLGLDATRISAAHLEDAGLSAPRPRRTCLSVDRLASLIGRSPPSLDAGIRRMAMDTKLRTQLATVFHKVSP